MSQKLGIKPNTVKQRLFQADIRPASKDAIYPESALDAIREAPMGRPKKSSTPPSGSPKQARAPSQEEPRKPDAL